MIVRKLVNIVDKEEFRIKLEEINQLVEEKDYKGAMEVVDSIDWRRVRNARTLCVVGEIYAANKMYEESRDIFVLAHHRAHVSKNIISRLVEINLKLGNIEEANDYYEEFCSYAPNDSTAYILKYKILKEKKAPLEEQIAVLEEYKEKEFTEKWSYELANLYYRAGQKDKCEELCSEMVLWFSEGSYVKKALDLKKRMGTLTPSDLKIYEGMTEPAAEPAAVEEKEQPEEISGEETEAPAENEVSKEETEEPETEEVGTEASEDTEMTDASEEKEESAAEESFEDTFESDDDLEDGSEVPHIESISVRNERDLQGAETLQERISKGIRDLFGSKKPKEEPKEEEQNIPVIDEEDSFTPEEKFSNVPSLEKEGEEPVTMITDFEDEEEEELLQVLAGEPEQKEPENKIFTEEPEPVIPAEPEEEEKEFNLEEMILAAANAQGIEFADEKKQKEEEKEPENAFPEEIGEKIVEQSEKEILEDDEKLQEQEAEEVLDQVPATGDTSNIPDLEDDISFLADELTAESLEEPKEKKEEKRSVKDDIENDMFADAFEEGALEEEPEEPASEETAEAAEPDEEESLSEEEKLERFIDSITPEDEKERADIVPRERELRDEEVKLFSYFVKVPGMKEQLIDTLCEVQLEASDRTSRGGNVIVMGGSESGKTRLISGLIPAICKELNLEASKVAYVFAEQINGKNIEAIVSKLAGGFFVIEKANSMDPETAGRLNKAMEGDTGGLIVILEDDKIGMRKLIARYPKLAAKFTSIINIPVFTNDELANFARIYAMENGYRIDNMGMLGLYNQISQNQKEDVPMNIGAVKNLVDNAIAKTQGGLFKKSSKKRMDRDGYILLHEKDFS